MYLNYHAKMQQKLRVYIFLEFSVSLYGLISSLAKSIFQNQRYEEGLATYCNNWKSYQNFGLAETHREVFVRWVIQQGIFARFYRF